MLLSASLGEGGDAEIKRDRVVGGETTPVNKRRKSHVVERLNAMGDKALVDLNNEIRFGADGLSPQLQAASLVALGTNNGPLGQGTGMWTARASIFQGHIKPPSKGLRWRLVLHLLLR